MRRIVVSLCSVVLPFLPVSAAVVINEIHYNPDVKTEPAEFVELINAGTITVNLAGWTLSSGFNYTFPATNLTPGRFVVVAQNPAFLQTKFAVSGALGPFNTNGASGFSKYADKVTLRNPAGQVEDEVSYQIGFPWPTVGDPPGYSIELINPGLDNDLGGNWRASTNGPAAARPTPGRTNTVYALNAPPAIRQVEHLPKQPAASQPVSITAKVTDPDGVASVVLQYQIVDPGAYIKLTDTAYTNSASWVSVSMNDAGTGGDALAGDDVYTYVLPASLQVHRRLIRYRITVTDSGNRSVRVPYADDPQPNFAYFCYNGVPAWTGAVQPGNAGANGVPFTVGAQEMNRLPVYQLITRSNEFAVAIGWAPGQPNNQYGGDNYLWTGTLVVDGEVYDHIGFRCRGGVWRYSMGKNAMKFALNRGHDLVVKDNWGRKLNAPWRRLSFRPNIQQGDYLHRGEQGMFEGVGYRLYELTGAYGLKNVQLQFRVIDDSREVVPGNQYEGDFYGLWLGVEEEDGRFLEERGLPDGNIYDMEGGSGTLNHTGALGPANKSDLNFFLAYGTTEAWWRTNLDLRPYYSYQAISQGIHQYDIADGKNYFYYKNPVSGLWQVWPWDLDLTWADNMYRGGQTGGDEPFKSRVLSNFASPGTFPAIGIEFRNRVREIRDLLFNTDEAFKLIDEYWWMTRGTNSFSIVDADRSFWDYNPVMLNSSIVRLEKAGNFHFYQWQNEPGTSNNFGGAAQMMKNYIRYRTTNANFSLDTISVDNTRPARPSLTYTGPASYPINRLTFRSSAYSGSNPFGSMRWHAGEITAPGAAPFDPDKPRRYEIETVWDSGPVSPFTADITIPAQALRVGSRYRVRVLHTDTTGRNSNWSLPIEFTCGEPVNQTDLLNYLRITEVMFNPPAAGYEYVELYNSSSTITLDLSGVKFTQGIDYTFTQGTTLPPGAYLVLVGTSDIAGFRAYYGLDGSVTVIGQFSGGLNNGGEQLVLRTSAGGTDIVNFNYGDGRGWPPQADGTGHSLVLLDSALAAQGNGAGDYAGNWRPSTSLRGSPGRADAVAPPGILLNEIVAHTDFTAEFDSNDWIELYNATDASITLGPGWYLSDDGSAYTNLMKWAIPSNTTITAHGFVSFDEVTGFHDPTNIGFGLSKAGEQVFLSYLPGNAQDRVVDAVTFKAQANGWSLGRYPDGGPFWYALRPPTRDAANTVPVGGVVISEIMYRPPDVLVGTNATDNSLDEFIEIYNADADAAMLFNTNGTWRLNGGVDFVFPTNVTLLGGKHLLVVNFDPATNAVQLAAFKSLYGITDPGLSILGPYSGKLANNSDRVALELPQHPDGTNDPVSWVIVDEVLYADQAPWPCGSDGTGNSLQRLNSSLHGSDPANWSAEPPTAGRPREDLPAGLPAITAQPQDRVVATNGNVSFSVSVCGTPPFTYQWRFNNAIIPNATNATLNLLNVTPANAGLYSVVVSNPAGSTPSAAASLIVQFPPIITVQPQPATMVRDQSATFSVTVGGGTPPFGYQWQFGGVNINGATNSTLLLTNVQTSQAGNYAVRVFNTAGSIVSSNALLTVLIPATITQQPASTTNRLTLTSTNPPAYAPSSATFTARAVGTGTLTYQWKFNGVNLPGANSSNLVVSGITPAQGGAYTLMATDDIGPTESLPAILNVFLDPVVILHPVSQKAVPGANVTFSVSILGSPPPFGYEWRKGSTPWSSNTSSDTVHFFTTNVFALTAANSSTGQYRVIIRNIARPSGTASSFATLLMDPDSDGDGIPDAWESSYGPDATSLAPGDDLDGDGMKNWEEYVAGTDPTNALSYLRVENIQSTLSSDLRVQIEFNAVSNRTYSVLFSEQPGGPIWSRVADVAAASTNRTVRVFDQRPATAPPRFYRLATPKNP